MKIKSFKSFSFSGDYWAAINDEDAYGLSNIIPTISARRNDQGEITGMTVGERPIAVQIGYTGAGGFEAGFLSMLGQINALDPNPGELVIEFNDTTEASCMAVITTNGAVTDEGEANVRQVTFLTTDPLWHATTSVSETPVSVADNAYGGYNNLTIDGDAPVYGTVRLTPTATSGQTQARSFTVTNSGTRTMRNFPIRVDVGDVYSDIGVPVDRWFAILVDGFAQRAEFIRNYDQLFYIWFVVPYLAPGQTLDCMVIKNAGALPEWTFSGPTEPAFNYRWTNVSAASGTTTSADFGSPAWDTDMWDDGVIEWLDGPNAGTTKRITSSTADTINWSGAITAVSAGDTALIRMSANGYWTWRVQQTERSNRQRGLWWIDKGQKAPSEARYSVPGAWYPYLYYNNADEVNQAEWTPVNVGTVDYFSILDVDRTWDNATTFKKGLRADGISISTPFPIVSLKFNEQFKNPNSMCRMFLGSRTAGSGDFIEEWTRTTASNSLTTYSSEHTETMEDDTYQLYLGVIPGNNTNGSQREEIGTEWAADDGTATSATSTVVTDTTKEWITDQWIGGTATIVSGLGAGQVRSVTDSGTDNFTTSAWTTTPDSTSRYRLKQKKLIATARTHDIFSMTWDTTDLDISALSAWTDVYVVDRILYIDRDTSSSDPPYQQVLVGEQYTGRHLVLSAGETLVYSGEEMRAWIEDGSGTVLRVVPPRAFIVQDVEPDGTVRLAEKWLWLTPGAHDIKISTSAAGDDYDLGIDYVPAWFS